MTVRGSRAAAAALFCPPSEPTRRSRSAPAKPSVADSISPDETVVGTANALRDYFASEAFRADSVVANRQLAENTILVFRGSDA
jgi:hypothetical protein